jgi:PAS domain S-box-containing protein
MTSGSWFTPTIAKLSAASSNAPWSDGKPYEYQARFLLRDGSERVLLTRGSVVPDATGRALKRVGVTQDITDRINAERALRQSEERYRDLVENSADLICLHDLQGRLLWMNEPPAQILGYTSRQLIGRRIRDMLEPELRDQFDLYIQTIRRDGRAKGLMRVVSRSGERRIWEYHNTLRTEGPHGPVVRGMAHDVTDLKRAERALHLLAAQLLVSQDVERQRIAHDLQEGTAQDLTGVRMGLGRLRNLDDPAFVPRCADRK